MNNIEHFVDIGIALSTEKNHHALLELILKRAMLFANADGGTIYSVTTDKNEQKSLVFDTVLNNSLACHLGGTSTNPIDYPNIKLFNYGKVNNSALVAIAGATGQVINVNDVYHCTEYDLTQAKIMDKRIGYHTQSVLTLPMQDHQQELNGVIQLINATDPQGKVITFEADVVKTITALTSLAAVILTNKQLIDEMENLFAAFSRLIASAIDRKSPYTGNHCRRVPEITMLLAKACHDIDCGPLTDFNLAAEDFHELSVAAWLHDCGKVATPEYVMDKSKKLETIFDRIELVNARFEIAARDITYSTKMVDKEKLNLLKQLNNDRAFINDANTGGEFFDDDKITRVYQIAKHYKIMINGINQAVINDDEVLNLITKRGTLTAKERQIINDHMKVTVEMLESMPFPKHLKNVPEFACGHHEKMDGTGYPKGLTRDQMSTQARIMAIADVFEALTSNDRPYKAPKTLSETLTIMGYMKLDNHLDPDLFDVFIQEKVYLEFANKFLDASQIDDFDIQNIPGYQKIA
ncbi:HD domain-containing phosphohydrolase [Colwellia hornerae]|uniref:HD domain-containing protein n=1 Tax=Colwellia hornerae TaxID=89402 RepID=A0A5C6QJX2_9GAMM|nr:HD domain-containing phosphohydrolase [Colwellia hornerae]TWX53374.1 HD domain-containing protein [Colwellia hornerae]TWX60194.1 HD domain-containing protein [Colwellia hornerae]TWX69013.1 HD domain-containing protein [Colwellia hornerae]